MPPFLIFYEMKKILSSFCLLLMVFSASAQEIGLNFNHNPEIIDFKYVEKTGAEWIRTTPRILDYVDGNLQVKEDPGLAKVIEAGERGYKIAFGFRWDFKKRNLRLPQPGSEREQKYFEYAKNILEQVGPYLQIFKLGNEPNLETLAEDMVRNDEGVIPLVRFTRRLLEEVVKPYYKDHTELNRPDVYVGSFPRLFMKEEQEKEGIIGMITYANESEDITGLSVHLHISKAEQIDQSLQFVRSLMPEKPIIVPEFSFHRLYKKKLDEPLAKGKDGKRFVEQYNYDPNWKLYDWFAYANTNGVSVQEWSDLFATLDWYPQHNLLTYYEGFQKYGVVLATYPLLQQSAPEEMDANSNVWFINPVFCKKSLLRLENGEIAPNPLHYEDFKEIIQRGKNQKS